MATTELKLGVEEQQIIELINQQKNFLLSGGAGSGKTYSLVQIVRKILQQNPYARIACITYTRSARDEIQERVQAENLRISTIHDFLWDCIKPYRLELKKVVIDLINEVNTDDKGKETRAIRHLSDGEESLSPSFFDDIEEIQYREVRNISKGVISHDEVIKVANRIFKEYQKLRRIVQDRFQYVFIDEYQDTFPDVIEIFLNFFEERKTVIGCFGDEMQAIYDKRVGDLNKYIAEGKIVKVKKKENRRNPRLVIELANRLRTDELIQKPSQDITAPNMINGKVKEGEISFIHSENANVEDVKKYLETNHNWDFSGDNSLETKELNLTHNLIAERAGFQSLLDIYNGDGIIKFRDRIKKYIEANNIAENFNDFTFGEVVDFLQKGKMEEELRPVSPTCGMQEFIDDNKSLYEYVCSLPYHQFLKTHVNSDKLTDEDQFDPLIKQLMRIKNIIYLYKKNDVNEFLGQTMYKLSSIKDKKILKERIEELIETDTKTINEVIDLADKYEICVKEDGFDTFIDSNPYLYKRLSGLPFSEFQNFYYYHSELTPFSTQHKVKGQEFNDVLVVLDNGRWNKYNFQYLFEDLGNKAAKSRKSVLERTQKIFYVCCTRAKERLVVFYHNPSKEVIEKAKEWFGESNVISL